MLHSYIDKYLAPFYDYVTGRKPSPKGDYFAFSYSSIAQLAQSPLHFFIYVVESKFAPKDKDDTDAQLVGKVFHNIVLDRHCMGRNLRYAEADEWCGLSRATKEGKVLGALFEQWQAMQQQATPEIQRVPKSVWDKAEALAYAVTGCYSFGGKIEYINPRANDILSGAVDTEIAFSYACERFGVPIRGYIDLIGRTPDGGLYLADLKSLRAVDSKSVYYTVRDSAYDLQAYLYSEAAQRMYGERPRNCYLVCAGESIHSNIYEFSPTDLSEAGKKYRAAMRNFAACVMADEPTAFLRSYS
jgi:hypothetical protein